jgi:hypothetical protein
MSFDIGKFDLSKYDINSWKPAYSLKFDLRKRTDRIIKSNPDILKELNYNNPPIKENQIYIIKTTPKKYGYGGGRKIKQEVEVGMNWDENCGIYEEVWFGNYVAIIKLPKKLKHLQRNEYSERDYFGIMLDDKEANYNRHQFSRSAYPIYFKKGSSSCGTDGYAGAWHWYDSYDNDYGFPTGSVWAALEAHPLFINWPIINPMGVKE